MKKNLLYLFLLIGLTANAKHLTASDSNFESKSEKEYNIVTVTSCTLNVEIAQTLDMPTSEFFVIKESLNGTAPYTYFLDGELSPNGYVFYTSNLNKGIHTVTVQDSNGCSGSGTFEVLTPPLSITTTVNNPTCIESGSIICAAIGGVEPYAYSIYYNEILVNSLSNVVGTIPFTNVNPGVYRIQVMDAIGTTSSTIAELIPPTPIAVTTTHTDSTCNGLNDGTISIIATGGTAPYMFSIDNGITFTSNTEFNNLPKRTYSVIVKDALGCTTETSVFIDNQQNPIDISTFYFDHTDVSCNGLNDGSIKITDNEEIEAYTYSIAYPNNNYGYIPIIYQNTATFSNLTPGTYVISIKNSYGCVAMHSITITELRATAIITSLDCRSGATVLCDATGGTAPYTYAYVVIESAAPAAGLYLTSSSAVLDYNISAIWDVYVKDFNGCTTKTSVVIGEPTVLTATAIITKPLDCISGATVVCGATGGSGLYEYSLDGSTYSSTSTFSNLIAGVSYTIFVKDATYGCVSNTTINIEPLSPLTPTITATKINCKGDTTGVITIIAKGGAAPYMFSIDNGVTFTNNPEFYNLSAGTYNVIVKDANGCVHTETVIITEPALALYAALSIENQAITVNTVGGTGIIHYAISPYLDYFFTSNTFANLTPGNYELIAQDENGCYIFFNTIVNPSAPLLNGQKTLDIKFTPGQTLADIIVDGQGIKWYSNPGTSNNKSQAPEPTLPSSTLLVDNTTYYASQTINGYESKERLAVTTKLSLSTADFVLSNFKFYPNPIKNSLTISNTDTIDEVVFISVKGDVVLTKQINSTEAAIDLSGFSKGLYFLKIKAEGTEKTIKLIKE